MHDQKPEIWEELNDKKDMGDEIVRKIESAIGEFQAQYAAGGGPGENRGGEPVAA
jgi:hypothetical protein